MGRACITTPGTGIVRRPPFSLLPDFVRAPLARRLDALLDVCVTVPFDRRICPCETGTPRLCWDVFTEPVAGTQVPEAAFSVTGVVGAAFEISAPGEAIGIPNLLKISGRFSAAQAGYRIDVATGRRYIGVTGNCPGAPCVDEEVSGRLVLVLKGGLEVSSSLLQFWNGMTLVHVLGAAIAGDAIAPGLGTRRAAEALSLLKGYLDPKARDGTFSVQLVGPGGKGGAVFDVGPFTVRPP